ncbi:TolC family protein [Sphingobacterium hotanense]|uniref:TolC family protein n=1 Tax=Sphingobacterium hotanense TaxID=649196 RepID=UPI0011F0C39D|nr:TolC family protein [Sphingobacterium hotanense]
MQQKLLAAFCALFILSLANRVFAQEEWSLKECMDYAVQQNRNVALSKLDVENKSIDIQIAKREKLPNLNAFSNISSNFGQSQDIFGNNARNDNFSNSIGLSSSVSLLNFGRIKNSVIKTEALVNASKEDVELARRNTRMQVAQAYLQVLLQKEMARLIDSSAIFSSLQLQKIQRSTDLGVTALSVLYEAKANYSRDVQKKAAANQQIDKAILALKYAMNMQEDQEIRIDDKISFVEELSRNDVKVDLYSNMIWNEHPLIKKYQYLNESVIAENKIIRSSLYPSIDLSVNVGSFYFNNLTQGFGKLPYMEQIQNNFSQQVTLSLNVPIYNRNSVKYNLQKNKIVIQQNAEQLALGKQQFNQEMQGYLLDYKNYENQLALSNEALDNTRLAFDISQKSFDAGKISIYDLNTSRANLLNAESETIQVRYNMAFAKLLIQLMATGDITF